ncbi:MAG: hypothetical protein ACE5ID_04720, partial [Acidobacteriota bacterium]
MTKRSAPSLAVLLVLALVASGSTLATRGKKSSIPDAITVSDMTVKNEKGLTEVVLKGDFPL